MGNSSTKEQRQPPLGSASHSENVRFPHSRSVSENGALPSPSPQASSSDSTTTAPVYSTRHGRSSRPDLSFLGIGNSADRDIVASLESRRETKQEREARRLERERVAREKERERSMKFESVDGGYLVTQGVYTGPEDFNKPIVRHLMIERRLAPFFKGLNDHSSSWTDDQLVAAARGQPVVTGAAQLAEDAARPDETPVLERPTADVSTSKANSLAVASRSPSPMSDSSANISPAQGAAGLATFAGVPHAAAATTTTTGATLAAPPPFRPRSKTLASLTGLAKNHSQDEMTPQEIHLPKNPLVDGRPLEAFLYRNAAECPICFLYYPPYLNRTRCCDQPICSECFVQIKRPDPHPPEHADPGASTTGTDTSRRDDAGELLVSEPAACPFCVQPELGVTYDPPPFRCGLTYANHLSMHAHATSAMSSSSSLASVSGPGSGPFGTSVGASRRRTTSISATSPNVITTDRIRPDWAQKLANARAHAARRSAAATALHTAAYLMGGFSGSESRSFAGFGRRRLARGARAEAAEASASGRRRTDSDPLDRDAQASSHDEHSPAGREGRSSRRRPRLEDLEEMMMMEAIRLSIASEEERKRKEEAENQQRKLEASTASAATSRNRPELFRNKTSSGQPNHAAEGRAGDENSTQQRPSAASKGKSVDRSATAPTIDAALSATPSSAALASTLSSAHEWESLRDSTYRRPSSHSAAPASAAAGLSTMTPASATAVGMPPPSSSSSDTGYGGTSGSPTRAGSFRAESAGGKAPSATGTGTAERGTGLDEPMLSFSSLAAMIGHDETTTTAAPTTTTTTMTDEPSPLAHLDRTTAGKLNSH